MENKPKNFNPRSPCGERRHLCQVLLKLLSISIHAPRAGSDAGVFYALLFRCVFQSTLPVRGATRYIQAICRILVHFNPRSPCGERLWTSTIMRRFGIFQSTLPVRGATGRASTVTSLPRLFQSTLPVRGATSTRSVNRSNCSHFNPRSPCGERPETPLFSFTSQIFQSTLPVRGAT